MKRPVLVLGLSILQTLTSVARSTVLGAHRFRVKVMPRHRRPPLRQFQCDDCSRRWWAREEGDDPVSECRRCRTECDVLPPEEESGWAKFECECGNEFSGFATLIDPAESPCYVCGTNCAPERVLRFGNNRPQRSENRHSCTGVNCYNRVQGIPARGQCVHPKSKRQRQ